MSVMTRRLIKNYLGKTFLFYLNLSISCETVQKFFNEENNFQTLLEKSDNMENSFISSSNITVQEMKFSVKDFVSKCDQIRRKLRIWSYFLEKSLVENFIFYTVYLISYL